MRPLSLLCARCLHTCPTQPYSAWKAEALCLHFKEEEDYSLHRCCYLAPLSSPQVFEECKFSTITASWVSLLRTDQLLVCPGGTCTEAAFCPMLAQRLSLIHIKGKVHERLQKGPYRRRRRNSRLSGQRAQTELLATQAWASGSVALPFPLSPSPHLPAPIDVVPLASLIPPPVITCTHGPISCP